MLLATTDHYLPIPPHQMHHNFFQCIHRQLTRKFAALFLNQTPYWTYPWKQQKIPWTLPSQKYSDARVPKFLHSVAYVKDVLKPKENSLDSLICYSSLRRPFLRQNLLPIWKNSRFSITTLILYKNLRSPSKQRFPHMNCIKVKPQCISTNISP